MKNGLFCFAYNYDTYEFSDLTPPTHSYLLLHYFCRLGAGEPRCLMHCVGECHTSVVFRQEAFGTQFNTYSIHLLEDEAMVNE